MITSPNQKLYNEILELNSILIFDKLSGTRRKSDFDTIYNKFINIGKRGINIINMECIYKQRIRNNIDKLSSKLDVIV